MHISDNIKRVMVETSIDVIAQRMGYTDLDILQWRINRTLRDPYLGLLDGIFDGVHKPHEFLASFLVAIKFDFDAYGDPFEAQLDPVDSNRYLLDFGYSPWVFIETEMGIYNSNTPYAVLALMETHRQIEVALWVTKLARDDQINVFKSVIENHLRGYQRDNDGAPILRCWGKPVAYHCHVLNDLVMVLNTQHELIEVTDAPVNHDIAQLPQVKIASSAGIQWNLDYQKQRSNSIGK